MKKGERGHNVVSIALTLIVILIYLVPNFASAVTLEVTTDKSNYISSDSTVTFALTVNIQENERIPIQSLILKISPEAGGDAVECRFSASGEKLSACPNIEILNASAKSRTQGPGYGYGYGYGDSGWFTGPTDFGYGYGYGYGYGDQNIYPSELSYTIAWGFASANAPAGSYRASLEAKADDGQGVSVTYKTTSPAEFSITSETDVESAYNGLTADKIKKDNTGLDNVVSDLNLITIGLKDTKIKWTSNSTAVNAVSGKVTRPKTTDEDSIVKLKANISKANTSLSKSFIATVLKESQTDAGAVSEALSLINIENMLLLNNNQNNITTNLNLSTAAQNGVSISWSSSNPSVVENTGSVSRTGIDTTVTLTVKASRGITSGAKSFTVIVKGTVDQDLIDLSNAKLALTSASVLNGNPALDNIIADLNLPASLPGHSVNINWSSDKSAIAANGTVTRSAGEDIEVKLTATFTKNLKTLAKQFILTVKKKVAPAEIVDNVVTVDAGETEIVVDTTNVADLKAIDVPSSVADDEIISLNLDAIRDDEGKLNLSTNNLTLSRNTSSGISYAVALPQGTIIKGSDKWNGVINLPTLKQTSEVTPTAESGVTKTVDVVIEVGFSQGQLNFTKAAKLTIPNQAGKKAGYTDAENIFHTIPACTSAQTSDPDTLAEGADCFTSEGSDMLIWTKHFTKFAAYTETATDTGGDGGSGGGGAAGGGGGGGGGGGPLIKFSAPVQEPAPEPKGPEEKIAVEEKKEEVQEPEGQPVNAPEVQQQVQKSGLGAITGAVVGKLFGAKNRSIWIDLSFVIFILVGFISFHVKVNYGGLPTTNPLARAAYLHKIAQEVHRKGKHKKAEKLYKRAQMLRERGERGLR